MSPPHRKPKPKAHREFLAAKMRAHLNETTGMVLPLFAFESMIDRLKLSTAIGRTSVD